MTKREWEKATHVPGWSGIGLSTFLSFGSSVLSPLRNATSSFDQSNISSTAQNTLNDLVKILNKYPDTDLEIQGHTDNTGTDKYNQSLSERRSSTVSNYLTSHGIVLERVKTVGFGESAPKYSNDTESGRAQNRRVEFLITANEKMKADAKKEAGN